MPERAPGNDDILRLVAPNPGPMTLAGTNTYVVGSEPAYVIDPGPDDPGHIAAVRDAAEARGGVGGVLLTHGHADHSAGVERLGAPLLWGEVAATDEATVMAAALAGSAEAPAAGHPAGPPPPDATDAGPFAVVPTPGHAADHAVFVLGRTCFCGDLVLGEGSTIVPPAAAGGSLADYMGSLVRLAELDVELLAPGHGPWITSVAAKLAEYVEHRASRERRLVAALERGERSREQLLEEIWDDVPAPLRPAAALAMQAHLEKLEAEGCWRSLGVELTA